MKNLRRLALINVLLLFAALTALADDPPGRAVRLKYISGAVSIQPGGVNDWVAAVVNRPLTTADRVWTDKEARAELHLGSAALRMNAETSLTLTNVSDDIVQLELDQGTLNLHIRHLFGGETYEIDTPNQAFTILKSGDYRFDVDPNADTTSVTVWRGEGEANGQGPGVKLRSDQQASFTGGTSLQHEIASAPGLDGFDDWCRVRDEREDHAKSYQYVSADVVGADDLDDYGTWRVMPNYGPVWVPAVAPGWAPYHYGHWVWVEPWGWTWVDDAPWGFAPCHYGRWVYAGGFWGWAPGPVVVAARPVYAPALVAWVGGPNFGVSVSFGGGVGVGWFPLGWGEPYVPSYRVSRTYFQQVNVTNTHITNITNVTNNYYVSNNNTTVVNNNIRNVHYANQTVAGAVTAVPARTLTNSEPVARAAVSVPAGELRMASLTTAAQVAPARSSLLGARAGAPTAAPPAQVANRTVVSHMAPPPRPIPFEAKQEALARTPGRPLDTQTEARIRASVATAPASRMQMPANTAPAAPASRMQVPAQPPRPGAPGNASSATMETRPVPRPGTPQAPSAPSPANVPSAESKAASGTTPQPAQQNMPGRMVPRPPQPGTQPAVSAPAQPAGATPQPANMPRPIPRPAQPAERSNVEMTRPSAPSSPHPAPPTEAVRPNLDAPRPAPRAPQSAAGNTETARPNVASSPRPAPAIETVRPTVDTSRPAPRAPQSVSMPRNEQPVHPTVTNSQENRPARESVHPAPSAHAQSEARPQPAPKSQPRHEEKSEHKSEAR